MAVIDTLKLARALHDKGGFSQEAADATAEALNAALGEDVATKADVGGLRTELKADITALGSRIDGKITAIEGKLNLLIWAVGINVAATITMLVKHW
jgi:hypothetical protein